MNGEVVSQDSRELRLEADYISRMGNVFQKQYEELFQEMESNISEAAKDDIAWWGPQAGLFLKNFNDKKAVFEQAHKNINSMAENLEQQADAWDAFENV